MWQKNTKKGKKKGGKCEKEGKESSVQTTGRTNKRAVDSYLVLLLWGWGNVGGGGVAFKPN